MFWPSSYSTTNQIAHFEHVQGQGNTCNRKHEYHKDGLLCGSGHEALCGQWAGGLGTQEFGYHYKAIEVILANDESNFQDDFEKELSQVATQQLALDSDFAIFIGVFRCQH